MNYVASGQTILASIFNTLVDLVQNISSGHTHNGTDSAQITSNVAQTIKSDAFDTTSNGTFVARTGGNVTITKRTASSNIILFVSSYWQSLDGALLYARINVDSLASYRNIGGIAGGNNTQGLIGGTFVFGGLAAGSHNFSLEVALNGAGHQASNLCSTYGMAFEMVAMEV